MPWPQDTWDDFAGLLTSAWPGEFTADQRAAYRVLLDDVEPQAVVGALKRLLHAGQRFRPSVAEILAAVRDDPSRPSFEEAYAAIYGSRGILAARREPGAYADLGAMRRAESEAAKARAADFHPLIAGFVLRYGIDRLRTLELHDPQWGDAKRKELHDAWDRHVEAFEGREVAALAAGTGARGLRQLDPLKALGLEPPATPLLPAGDAA